MSSFPPADAWQTLVASTGLGDGELELEQLPGGANNRTYAVRGAARPLVLKHYYADDRDRLGAEWSFLEYAWGCGIDAVAEPIAVDREASLGLQAMLPGVRLAPGEVEARHVDQAIAFIADLQRERERADLPIGAEACFEATEHLTLVGRRVEALSTITDPAAASFAAEELTPAWQRIEAEARLALARIEAPATRVVSPSDFGFHNALVDDGRVRFHDFEYAGWDDGAKLLCDFFCQPEVPVPASFLEAFAAVLPATAAERGRALLDAYRVKWCCIMLNDFLGSGSSRRRYALGSAEPQARRMRQLQKARAALEPITR
jgi:Phosphotransferase enzyme family